MRTSRAVGDRSDDELLRDVGRGDREAFEELHARTAPWLVLRLRRRCRDDETVAEVLQETYLAVWRAAAGYAGEGQSAGWLWSIASRKLVDSYRRGAVRPVTVPLAPDGAELDGPASRLPPAASAEDDALASGYEGELATALHALSPELRDVLQATVLDGLSTREAATLLGIPEGTVKTRARRARHHLREALS